ncbi:MAG: hypothetical protein AB4058_00030 [Microcystaceae cyanobacterium]
MASFVSFLTNAHLSEQSAFNITSFSRNSTITAQDNLGINSPTFWMTNWQLLKAKPSYPFPLNKEQHLLNKTETDQILDQPLNSELSQSSQPNIEYSSPSVFDLLPLGALVLVGLAGASYGILRQYSHNPQWHLDVWRKFKKLIGQPQETVSENAIELHEQAMTKIKKIERQASYLESQRFDKQDFIHLSLLHIQVKKNVGDYEGIGENAQLFQTIMMIKKHQEHIHYIEVNHQGYIHQKFYQDWLDILEKTTDIQLISQSLQQKFNEYLPEVQTETGQESLREYLKAIDQLLECPYQPLGLNLYKSLQSIDGADYQALTTITNLLSDLSDDEITNLKTLTCFVIAHRDIFDQIGKQINLPIKYQQNQIYAKILQYYAMSARHETSLRIFNQLLDTLKQWYEAYQMVMEIRREYPSSDYQQPPSFKEKIHGSALYLKYQKRLSNPNTGLTYLEFTQETALS